MDHKQEIYDLAFSSTGMTAADMTHLAGVIGDGNMADGFQRLAEYFTDLGIEIGEKRGVITGTCMGAFGMLTLNLIVKEISHFKNKQAEREALIKRIKADIGAFFCPIRANKIVEELKAEESTSILNDKTTEEVAD